MKVFIQIGTNDGNDLFRKKVMKETPDLVILVEPNADLKATIQKNYKNIQNTHI
jgi:FkbM family methyltransferase